MAISTDIKNTFRDMNKNWSSRIFTILLIGALAFLAVQFFTAKSKTVKEDCTAWKEQVKEVTEQNRQLIGAFIEIKKDLSPIKPVAYYWNNESGFETASFRDTVPSQRTKERMAVQKVMSKIDSILLKWKQDSINKKNKS